MAATAAPSNPFFGNRVIKKSENVQIREDFNPFKVSKVPDAKSVGPMWAFSGKPYRQHFVGPAAGGAMDDGTGLFVPVHPVSCSLACILVLRHLSRASAASPGSDAHVRGRKEGWWVAQGRCLALADLVHSSRPPSAWSISPMAAEDLTSILAVVSLSREECHTAVSLAWCKRCRWRPTCRAVPCPTAPCLSSSWVRCPSRHPCTSTAHPLKTCTARRWATCHPHLPGSSSSSLCPCRLPRAQQAAALLLDPHRRISNNNKKANHHRQANRRIWAATIRVPASPVLGCSILLTLAGAVRSSRTVDRRDSRRDSREGQDQQPSPGPLRAVLPPPPDVDATATQHAGKSKILHTLQKVGISVSIERVCDHERKTMSFHRVNSFLDEFLGHALRLPRAETLACSKRFEAVKSSLFRRRGRGEVLLPEREEASMVEVGLLHLVQPGLGRDEGQRLDSIVEPLM